MAELPGPVRDFIDALTEDLLAPAFMLVSDDGGLSEWGGALESYGISGLEEKMQVADHFPFLSGILPVDSGGVFLPNVQTRTDVFADIYFFNRPQGTWILLLDATANVKTRQTLQQRAYDVSLHAADLELEGKTLHDVNSMLEQRVSEQTRELSETVVRLQQELADSKRTQRALTFSEARFRSLYDSNMIGILSWNANGTIVKANDIFLQSIGYFRDDLALGLINWNQISPDPEAANDEASEAGRIHWHYNRRSEISFARMAATRDFSSVPVLAKSQPNKALASPPGLGVESPTHFSLLTSSDGENAGITGVPTGLQLA
jgi:PAS domain-containing protein